MKSWGQWLRESFKLSMGLIRAQWLPLGLLCLVDAGFNIWAEDAMQLTGRDSAEHIGLQVSMAISDMIFGVILFLVLCWGIPKVRSLRGPKFEAAPFATPYLSSFFAEYLRMLAQIIMYALLLLLPGLYRYIQLIFVPLIAIFSRSYRAGNENALKLSERMALGRRGRIFAAFAGTTALGGLFEFMPEMIPDLDNIASRLVFAFLASAVAVWAYALIYLLFEEALEAL